MKHSRFLFSVVASVDASRSRLCRARHAGAYRQGEGPPNVGLDAYKGSQAKFNVTKTFSNGIIRVYGKYLYDRTPSDQPIPMTVTGSNFSPSFASILNFDLGFRNA